MKHRLRLSPNDELKCTEIMAEMRSETRMNRSEVGKTTIFLSDSRSEKLSLKYYSLFHNEGNPFVEKGYGEFLRQLRAGELDGELTFKALPIKWFCGLGTIYAPIPNPN
ncbi:hypothetical protein KAR91_86825 [Candidatus Pacearchaeota archaeon]|nr:hypothetical protein [Candidatus Pacearchaeota archaeon]